MVVARSICAVWVAVLTGMLASSVATSSPEATTGSIVFESTRGGNPDIYVMRADGTDVRRLTRDQAQDSSPNWSPDGSRVYFASDRSGSWRLYRMPVSGAKPTPIRTGKIKTAFEPRVSADGKLIAFESFDQSGHATVQIVRASGGRSRSLTPAGLEDTGPSWGPRGSRLVLSRGSPKIGTYSLYTVDAKTGKSQRLTSPPAGASDSEPDWSPSGKSVAFTRLLDDGNYDVYRTVARPGSSAKRLTTDPAEDGGPTWSPDEKTIIFRSARTDSYRLWKMSAGGAGQVPLMHGSKRIDVAADWTPHTIGVRSMHATREWSPRREAGFYCVVPPGSDPPRAGHDVVRGTASKDFLCGDGGSDWIHGYASGDELSGGSGNDRPLASSILAGDAGDDLVFARALSAPTGDCDYVDGGDGPDTAWVDKSPVPCGNGTSTRDLWTNVSVTRPP